MRIVDSRRLTGPSLLLDGPGAILDAACAAGQAEPLIGQWGENVRRLLRALDWNAGATAARTFPGGFSVAFEAPIDALYTATEVNEHACTGLAGVGEPPFKEAVARLIASLEREHNPALLALAAEAAARGVTFLSDTKRVSVGLGSGSRSWPLGRIPDSPGRVRWGGLHDIPVALVTGTNGKTTTVRLLGAMIRSAGKVAGVTSTDRVDVGGEVVATGDYSGPNGARTVLRDRRVEVGVLEVARGGILRRGLPVRHAEAALVTNVAEDHLGEYGIHDVETLADVKMVVAKVVPRDGRVVLNADDPRLLARGLKLAKPVLWITLDARHPAVVKHVAEGGDACLFDDGGLVLVRGGARHTIARAEEVPIAYGGAARYNVANALGAIGLAAALGLPLDAIRAGLLEFENSPERNPGRTNIWELGGVQVIVDFAHNPHGIAALVEMAMAMPARRRLIVLGQAGDRDDASIRELVRTAWPLRPDRIVIKEMRKHLRGRPEGEVARLIEDELQRLGTPAETIVRADSELEAVRGALTWARAGDQLLLLTHAERDDVLGLLGKLAEQGWAPGEDLLP